MDVCNRLYLLRVKVTLLSFCTFYSSYYFPAISGVVINISLCALLPFLLFETLFVGNKQWVVELWLLKVTKLHDLHKIAQNLTGLTPWSQELSCTSVIHARNCLYC